MNGLKKEKSGRFEHVFDNENTLAAAGS